MKIIRNLSQISSASPPLTLTIGNFDGVHLGHSHIISEIKKIAEEKKLASAILTFEPHPIAFLRPNLSKDFRITSLAQKLKIFSAEKIDYAIVLPFNKKLSEISARNFIREILVEILNIKHLAIGYDFTFGKNREGTFRMIEEESKNFHFDLTEVLPVKNSEQTCSSSLVRRLISEGKITEANQVLGRNFSVCGLVNEGRKLASQLGFPTMNVSAKPQAIKPKFGVYKTTTFIPHLNQKLPSITNFGIKPTICGDSEPLFETHIPNFSKEIYDKKIFVEFTDFLREEKKFSSIEELRQQIESDLLKCGKRSC